MQPLPFSEAELLNLFILLVHVCLRFIPFRWLFYSMCISYSILDSLSSVVFILCKNVLSLLSYYIWFGYLLLLVCQWAYTFIDPNKRSRDEHLYSRLHFCICVLFPLVLLCVAVHFSVLISSCTYYDEMIVSSVCSRWWNERTHSYMFICNDLIHANQSAQLLNGGAIQSKTSEDNMWIKPFLHVFVCSYAIGIDPAALYESRSGTSFLHVPVFIIPFLLIPYHSLFFP